MLSWFVCVYVCAELYKFARSYMLKLFIYIFSSSELYINCSGGGGSEVCDVLWIY